jgi:hypothetical protein
VTTQPETKDATYHIKSMRSAVVREQCGGIKAPDSHLFQRAVGSLLALGLTDDEIVAKYKETFPE